MEIKQKLTTYNLTKSNNKVNKYIVLHYTANNGDTAKNNVDYFASKKVGSSANYFCDEKEIWQCVLDKDIAWHVGTNKIYYNNCRNSNSIGIEMCSRVDSNGQYYIKEKTVLNAIELTKMLMKKYNIPIENILRHYDVTGKRCPAPFVDNLQLWTDFKARLINKEEEEEMIYNYIDNNMPEWARPTIQKLVDKGYLKGNEDGELGLNDTMLKIFVINDRAGLYN